MRHLVLSLAAMDALAAASTAGAQAGTAYLGVSLGEFEFNPPFVGDFDSASAWHIFGGYRVKEYFAFEVGYGKTDTMSNVSVSPPSTAENGIATEFSMLTMRALGVLPFKDSGVSVLGGFEYADAKENREFSVNGVRQSGRTLNHSGLGPYLAAQYDWDRVAVRLSFELYGFDDQNASKKALNFFCKF